jgi:hypothetical protein
MINKTNKQNRMNWRIIASNLREAREQLEEIERQIEKKTFPDEIELQLWLEHAYHHLNFAWNIRRIKTKEYAHLTDDDFNRWGQFPKDIELPKLEKKRTKKLTAGKQRHGDKSK